MKVVQMIDSVQRGGGAETLVYDFAKTAHAHNIHCVIVAIRKNDTELSQNLKSEGIEIREFVGKRLVNPIRFIKLLRYLKGINPDVIHTHLSGSTMLGVSAARLLKIPVVVTLHNEKISNEGHLYHGKLEAWLLKHWTSYIIAVGDSTAEVHLDIVGEKPMQVIPNAVRKPVELDPAEKQQKRNSIFPGYEGLIIVSTGSLAEQKGYANLLQALAKVKQPFKCMILGKGPLRESLEQRSRELQIEDKVRFLGLRSDVHELLGSSDIYVSSSLWEGLPMATLEAMYSKLPIVSTQVGHAEKLLQNNAGILVNAADIDMLADALERLLRDEELRRTLGQNAFTRVDAEYNNDEWMNKLKRVYLSISD